MMGPLPLTTSNSMLVAPGSRRESTQQRVREGKAMSGAGGHSDTHPSAGRGVRMSENMMTPSGLKARHGCTAERAQARV